MEVRREWQHIDILLLDEEHELAVLRIFQKDGWGGVWVDTYRG